MLAPHVDPKLNGHADHCSHPNLNDLRVSEGKGQGKGQGKGKGRGTGINCCLVDRMRNYSEEDIFAMQHRLAEWEHFGDDVPTAVHSMRDIVNTAMGNGEGQGQGQE